MIRNAGAKEVHMRISCPPTISPCFYGVDTPSKKELIAANKTIAEIRDFIVADSLAYLSLEGLKKACADGDKTTYCSACYTEATPPRSTWKISFRGRLVVARDLCEICESSCRFRADFLFLRPNCHATKAKGMVYSLRADGAGLPRLRMTKSFSIFGSVPGLGWVRSSSVDARSLVAGQRHGS